MSNLKAIWGFPGYFISDEGNLVTYWDRAWTGRGCIKVIVYPMRQMRNMLNPRGYFYVRLFHEDGKFRNRLVHRLVLENFVGPCPEGYEGCHRDGSRTNNRLGNLYWGTRSQNCMDTSRHGRNRNAVISNEQIDEMIELRKAGWSQKRLAARFGVGQPAISNLLIKRGLRKQYSGKKGEPVA